MKKTIVTMLTAVACVSAFAQGKVSLINDTTHLVYLTTDTTKLKAADQASAGLATTFGGLPSGTSLIAGLWAGTSSTAMSFYSSQATGVGTTLGPGRIANLNIVLTTPAIGLGVPGVFFQVKVWDASFGATSTSYDTAALTSYNGASAIFTMTTGASGSSSIINPGGTALSTWGAGAFDLGGGQFGAIQVSQVPVPEPSTLALAGLGAAAMLMFRRRK